MKNLDQNPKKYYKVTAERAHLGAGNETDILFYFIATNAYDALCKAKKMPGIKHHRLPLHVEEISENEYANGRKHSGYHREKQNLLK